MSGKFESTVGGEYIIDALARAARRGERLEFRHNNFTCEMPADHPWLAGVRYVMETHLNYLGDHWRRMDALDKRLASLETKVAAEKERDCAVARTEKSERERAWSDKVAREAVQRQVELENLNELRKRELDCAVARAKDLEAALGRAWGDVLYLRNAHRRMEPEDFKGLCGATMGRIEIALHPQPPPADRAEHHDAVDSDPGRDPGLKPKMNPAPCEDALEDRILQAAGHLRFVHPAGEVGVDSRAWAEVARLRHQGLSWVLEWVRAGHATPPPWLRVGENQTL